MGLLSEPPSLGPSGPPLPDHLSCEHMPPGACSHRPKSRRDLACSSLEHRTDSQGPGDPILGMRMNGVPQERQPLTSSHHASCPTAFSELQLGPAFLHAQEGGPSEPGSVCPERLLIALGRRDVPMTPPHSTRAEIPGLPQRLRGLPTSPLVPISLGTQLGHEK